ncbi:MAG: hypothetical protein K0U98_08415 [Deltaproteobacteria bacterium]|nr:hypothetical protein [Deltaproteobacteria bacterium]
MRVSTAIVVFLSVLLGPAWVTEGQGRTDYFNVESPQVHPIETARIGGHDYLFVCNTPDGSIEIYDTDETVPQDLRLLARVPTGPEPVTVRWHEELQRLYTMNFLGDSATMISVKAPSGPGSLTATVLETAWVGDEPMDVAFYSFDVPDGDGGTVRTHTFFATHKTLKGFGWYNALTLDAVGPGLEVLPASVPTGQDIDFDSLDDEIALNEPHAILINCGKLFILGNKGGNERVVIPAINAPVDPFDFDLFSADLTTGVRQAFGEIGTTNFNMAFSSAGDLYLVGAEAQNTTVRDEPVLAQEPTGFVKSMVYAVEDLCSGDATIHRRDLNLVPSTSGPPGMVPAAPAATIAQPTDVVLLENGGEVDKVFVAGFNSDSIGIIVPDLTMAPDSWARRRIGIAPVTSTNPNRPTKAMAGPRGLALKRANAGQANDPGDRLYVLNRLDNSVTILDPNGETFVADFFLANDPTPQYIHRGRRFMYDARLSGSGTVSCASCHIDGRTDALAWDLGTPEAQPVTIPPDLFDSGGFTLTEFPADKEFIVTQTLQGLLNWEVPQSMQDLFTNAPYHWRGDRADFTAFNPAFEGLLDGDELSTADMRAYEEFVNSIHYPSNPKQPLGRAYSGTLGDPDDDDTSQEVSGSGAMRGMKLYHIIQTDQTGSCAHCHSLPEGSNNMLTEQIGVVPGDPDPPPQLQFLPHAVLQFPIPAQPIETAQLKGLFQREARLDLNGSSNPIDSPIVGFEGLTHTGLRLQNGGQDLNGVATLNAFNFHFFRAAMCSGQATLFCTNLHSLNQFGHEFDWGLAPTAGLSYTVTAANKNLQGTTNAFSISEGQAKLANSGLAVQAFIGGSWRGFWYDFSGPVPIYREEPHILGVTLDRASLLNLVTAADDRLVLVATPLGSERRMAAPSGNALRLVAAAPSQIELLPMAPNTAYFEVPKLSLLWEDPAFLANPGNFPATNDNEVHGNSLSHTVRLYQYGLLQDGPPGAYGLDSVRHEAPRRFRVQGKGIEHGATLRIFTHNSQSGNPPNPNLSLEAQSDEFRELVLPIHPTDVIDDGRRIWETAVELEPLLFYRLMVGGQFAPGVPATYTDFGFTVAEPPPLGTFNPIAWNWHWVEVVNPGGARAAAGWQRLQITAPPP